MTDEFTHKTQDYFRGYEQGKQDEREQIIKELIAQLEDINLCPSGLLNNRGFVISFLKKRVGER